MNKLTPVPPSQNDNANTASDALSLRPTIPPEIEHLFGKRPLIMGEDPAVYDDLFARLAAGVKPGDIIEWLWVKDVVDLVWEAQR